MPSRKPTRRKARSRTPLERATARHQKMESRLRLSESLYHSLVDNLPLCLLRKDVRGRFTFANRRFCELIGRPLDEIVGKTDYDFYPKPMADKFRKDDIIVMQAGEIFDAEEENKSPGQETRYVHVIKTPLHDPSGKVLGVQVLFWDITSRRRAEVALAEQSDLLNTLLDNLPDFIYFKDAQGRFTRVNRALALRHGAGDPAALVGKTDYDLFTPEHAGPAFHDEQEILRTGEPIVGKEERETYFDGSEKWVSTTKMPLRDKNGAIVGTFGVTRDITDHKRAEQALAEQARLLATLMDGVPDRIFFKDDQSRFLQINRAQALRFGLKSPDEAKGKTDFDFFPREEAERFLRDEQNIMRTGVPIIGKLERKLQPDGTVTWTSSTKLPLRDPAGHIVGTFGINRDITALKRAEEALAEQAELLNVLMDNSPDLIYFKDAQGRFTRINRALAHRFKLADPALAVGKTDADFLNPELAEEARADEAEILRTGRPLIAKEEQATFPGGVTAWSSTTKVPLRDREGRVIGTFGISRDITERKQTEEQLVRQAFYDILTQLPNRALFMDRLSHRFRRARRQGGSLYAVLFLDLDRFKGVNDSLGHEAGDNLLITVARRLEGCLRPGDTVARLGGDEFTILLEEVGDASDAARVADRIQAALGAACNLGGVEVFTTASIGIALSSSGYERPEDMLRDADTAMYRAKAHGKARHEVFDAAMHERAVSLLQLETDLRRAVERGEFRLYYQPVVSLPDGRLTGFEALVRWLHPQRGLILPDTFIPLAEETGLITPIGLWVLREACRQTREWQQRFPSDPPLRISVNVSSRQFAQPDFVDQVRRILADTGLDPACLTLEITESAIMENLKATATMLGQIRDLSIQLFIDDFGTGYSSLSQLQHFPIDTLKVDRSFVSRMQAEGDNAEIVKTIVTLAKNLGLNVTAEGVETAEQLEALKRLDCGSAQGFYFSQPLDAVAAEGLMKDPPWKSGPPAPAAPPPASPAP